MEAASAALLLVLSLACVNAAPVVNGGVAFRGGDLHVGGSCGYQAGFPPKTALVAGISTKLYQNGAACGACYLISCAYSKVCRPGSVTVRVVSSCDGGKGRNATGPCTKGAFNLQPAAYDKIVKSPGAGVVFIKFRPTTCVTVGGVQFSVINGNDYYISVLIQNVGGSGALKKVEVSAGGTNYIPLTISYGAVYQHAGLYKITGRPLNFRLTASDGKQITVAAAVPANFVPSKFYQSTKNF